MVGFIPKVVDVSHYEEIEENGWQKAKDFGIMGVICKASQGTHYKDPAYDEFREGATAAGLLWGAYHFNTGEDVRKQIDCFLRSAQPDEHTLLALDFESNPKTDMDVWQAVDFLYGIEDVLKRKAIIYSGDKLKETIGQLDKQAFDYMVSHRLWLAQYGATPRLPRGFNRYWLWQYTGDGFGSQPHWVPGIRCPGNKGLDINVFNGTDEELVAQWV